MVIRRLSLLLKALFLFYFFTTVLDRCPRPSPRFYPAEWGVVLGL